MAVALQVFHGITAILFILFGTSIGAVAAAKGSPVRPKLFEVLMTPIVATPILILKTGMSHWLVLVLGVVCGFVASAITRTTYVWIEDDDEKASRCSTVTYSQPAWRRFLYAVGDYQSRLVLSLFYFTIVAPFSFIGKLTQNPLRLQEREGASYWRFRTSNDEDLSRPY